MGNQLLYQDLKLSWFGQSAILLQWQSHVIYIDPWQLPPEGTLPIADIVLITHEHPTHLNMKNIRQVVDRHSMIYSPPQAVIDLETGQSLSYLLVKELNTIYPGEEIKLGDIAISALPAHNRFTLNHNKELPHDPDSQTVGYIVNINGIKVYHAGDTDELPLLDQLHDIDIALVPISGSSVMNPAQAASLINHIKPSLTVPIHWGDISGTKKDALRFQHLTNYPVTILDPYSCQPHTSFDNHC